jgi:hypothetical protein
VSESTSINKRADERTMLLAVTIYATGDSRPARVRNLSTWGAMLDTAVAPTVGTQIHFRRGQLTASGTVVWADESCFGIRLGQPIEVSRWLVAPKNPGQDAVDLMFEKSADPTTISANQCASERAIRVPAGSVAAIEEIVELLTSLGDRLSDDMTVVGQHGEALQNVDRALQMLGRLKAAI